MHMIVYLYQLSNNKIAFPSLSWPVSFLKSALFLGSWSGQTIGPVTLVF